MKEDYKEEIEKEKTFTEGVEEGIKNSKEKEFNPLGK